MSDAILMLRLEHENIAHVLDLLEDQFRRLESSAPIDEPLLLLVVEYLKDFPEVFHHPKEDLVFRMLQQHEPDRAAALHDLDTEHEQLAQLTERFARDLRDVLDAPAEASIDPLHQYVDIYRQHIAAEELQFFPAVLESLPRGVLANLDARLFDRQDHLFDRAAEARFAHLRREIQRHTGDRSIMSGSGPVLTDEIALLRGLDSVDAFNQAMLARGLQLVPYRAGGFALERNGQWLLDIPDCDESRAGWCAYYYAKGGQNGR